LKLSDKTRQFASSVLDHGHIASFLEDESRYEYVSAHLLSALNAGYLCEYMTEESEQVASQRLLQLGIEERFLRDKQLKILDVNRIYPDGFDPRASIEDRRKSCDTAKGQGLKGLLTVRSTLDFFNSRRRILESFLSYESMFESAKLPCETTCLYPLGQLGPEQVLQTIGSHSHLLTPWDVMTSPEMFDKVFVGAFGKVLGDSATTAAVFYLKRGGCYTANLIEAGLDKLFGRSGAQTLRRPFQESLLRVVGGGSQ